MEFTKGARYGHFITRFEGKRIRRTDTRIYIHELTHLLIPWWSSKTNIKHHDIPFSGMIGHGISTENRFRIFHFQVPDIELIVISLILLVNFIKFTLEINFTGWHI